jgi:serine/threonine-protein kinase SRPK3
MPQLAQFVSDQTTDNITPLGLRPPEIVLGGEWDESVDIWTFGCMVSVGSPIIVYG